MIIMISYDLEWITDLIDLSDIRHASSVNLEIYNSKGILMEELIFRPFNSANQFFKINISELEPGLYYCRLKYDNRHLDGKLIVQ